MAKPTFLEAIDQRVLVCDGAMGTMLYAKGIFLNRSFDELNLKEPDLVTDVHQAYVRAGADVIETNTFGANRIKLGTFGLSDQVHAINLQGAKLARHAAREHAYVAGAIGPLGIRIEPWGKTGVDEAEEFFREQARALVEGGVDLFVLETFRDVKELGAAIKAVRSVCDLPIVAQVTTEEDGNSLDGTAPETFVPALESLGAQIVGLNCSVGPAAMLETIERMSHVGDGEAVSTAQRRTATRDRRTKHLSLFAGVHGLLRAPVHRQRRAPGRRVLRHDAGTHPAHQDRGPAARRRGERRHTSNVDRPRHRRHCAAGAAGGPRREVADGQWALTGRVRRLGRACCHRAGSVSTRWSSRHGSCGSTASTW